MAISGTRARRSVKGLRDALDRCVFLSLFPYGAAHLAGMAASLGRPPGPLAGVIAAAGQYPAYPESPHPDAVALLLLRLLLSTLDILAYLAMVALAFLLCAAIARAAAPGSAFPHPRLTGALRAATAPFSAWRDACHVAADRVAGAGTPRDAVLALVLGAFVAHSPVRLAGVMVTPVPRHDPLLFALDAQAILVATGAMVLLAVVVDRAVVPALARMWRGT